MSSIIKNVSFFTASVSILLQIYRCHHNQSHESWSWSWSYFYIIVASVLIGSNLALQLIRQGCLGTSRPRQCWWDHPSLMTITVNTWRQWWCCFKHFYQLLVLTILELFTKYRAISKTAVTKKFGQDFPKRLTHRNNNLLQKTTFFAPNSSTENGNFVAKKLTEREVPLTFNLWQL